MRILLINSNQMRHPWPVIPFGMCCVASAAEKAGHDVTVLDICFSKTPSRDVEKTLRLVRPDVVGISIRNLDDGGGTGTHFFLEAVKRDVVDPCRKVFDGPVVIGGPAVGISGAEMLHFFDLEYAIRGDGEEAFVQFLSRLEKGDLRGLPGLILRSNGRIVEENAPMTVSDLDRLPWARYHRYIDLRKYQRYGSPLQVQSKRGCKLSCAYCTYNSIEGKAWRLRDPQQVADEIEEIVAATDIRHIEFTDSTFNIPLDHSKRVLKAIIAKGLKLKLTTMGLNPAAVDEEFVGLMKQSGFSNVNVGAEAGCDAMLKSLGKSFDTAAVIRTAELLSRHRIPALWHLLVGGPGETAETLRQTFETMQRAVDPWDMICVSVGVRIYRGAPYADRMQRENPACTSDNFLRPFLYESKDFTLEECKRLVRKHAKEQPNVFLNEDLTPPLWLTQLGIVMLRVFASRQPVWRFPIVGRRIVQWLKRPAMKFIRDERKRSMTQHFAASAHSCVPGSH